jgi:iron complex transport system permease protein
VTIAAVTASPAEASTASGRRVVGPSLRIWAPALMVVLAASAVVAVGAGPADIDPVDVLRSGWHHLANLFTLSTSAGSPLDRLQDAIVWQGRAPRIVCAAAVGAGLALIGTVLQALTGNPLADPYLLGVSSGAAVGAVSVLVLAQAVPLSVAAFVGAILALTATLLLAGPRSMQPRRVILAGIIVGQGCSAIVSLIIFASATGDAYREIIDWLFGSVAGATWAQAVLAAGCTGMAAVGLLGATRTLDALLLGETAAYSLGIPVERTRWILFTVTAVLTAVLVSVSGAIGFVGLVIPHLLRLLGCVRHGGLLVLSGLSGAIYLIWADTVARTIFAPQEIPVGIVTAALGVPAFAWLLVRRGEATP